MFIGQYTYSLRLYMYVGMSPVTTPYTTSVPVKFHAQTVIFMN